jgi:hypothetical protein
MVLIFIIGTIWLIHGNKRGIVRTSLPLTPKNLVGRGEYW